MPKFCYIFIPLAIISIIGLSVFVVILSIPEKDDQDTIYTFPEEIGVMFDKTRYKEIPLIRKEITTYNEYYASAVFDGEENINILVNSLANIKLGDKISNGSLLGYKNGEEVLSSVNGIILYIEQKGDNSYNITCFNSESYYIEIDIPQYDYYKYNITYTSKFEYILDNEIPTPLVIEKIEYQVVNGSVTLICMPSEIDYLIMPGASVKVRYKTGVDECRVFVGIDGFTENMINPYKGENSYFSCFVESSDGYLELEVKFGRQIGSLVGIYLDDPTIEKIFVRQR
jgi:hypothetical protein